MSKYQKLYYILVGIQLLPHLNLMLFNALYSSHGIMGIETFFIVLSSIFLIFAYNRMKWAYWSLILITSLLIIPAYLLLYFYPMITQHKIISLISIIDLVGFIVGLIFVFPKLSTINK